MGSIEMFFFFVSGFIEETTLLLSHLSCFGGFTLGYDLTQRAGVRLFGETFHLTFNILHIHGHVFFWFGVHYVKERPQLSTFFVFTVKGMYSVGVFEVILLKTSERSSVQLL